MIAAGRLRHRIDIYAPAETRTATGGVSTIWELFTSNVAAEFAPLSVKERYMFAAQFSSLIAARVVIRYRDDFDARSRIKFRDKWYNIEGILADPDSGLEYVTIPVSEINGTI